MLSRFLKLPCLFFAGTSWITLKSGYILAVARSYFRAHLSELPSAINIVLWRGWINSLECVIDVEIHCLHMDHDAFRLSDIHTNRLIPTVCTSPPEENHSRATDCNDNAANGVHIAIEVGCLK